MSVTVANLQTLEKEAQVLRASIDASRVADAKQQLAHLKVRSAFLLPLRSVCCLLTALSRRRADLTLLGSLYLDSRCSLDTLLLLYHTI